MGIQREGYQTVQSAGKTQKTCRWHIWSVAVAAEDLDDSSSGVSLRLWCFGALISEAVKTRLRRPRHQLCSRAEACFKSYGAPVLMGAVGRRQPAAPEADESRRFKKHFLLVSGQ
ncbi:unnamed protein product [Boreogadus saida]